MRTWERSLMEELYRNQLRLVLETGYRKVADDISELCFALIKIQTKSPEGRFKNINLEEGKKRLDELVS